jgi:hypothetical protein
MSIELIEFRGTRCVEITSAATEVGKTTLCAPVALCIRALVCRVLQRWALSPSSSDDAVASVDDGTVHLIARTRMLV